MINVPRSQLLTTLEERTATTSTLVVGSPGSGKSWLLDQFAKTKQSRNEPVVFLFAEDYNVSSLAELQSALQLETEVTAALSRIKGPSPALVIDALDTLRAEASQKAFRDLIRSVHRGLPEWRVVASIRTYDALESVQLHALFRGSSSGDFADPSLPVSHIVVPNFSSAEVEEAFRQDARLEPIVMTGKEQWKELLRNPFNLWLLIHLLDAGIDVRSLTGLTSEVQLLERYWAFRIGSRTDAEERKLLLRHIVEKMVSANSVSLSASESYSSGGLAATFKGILSDEIIRVSNTGRVSFRHNIIFDFAVSKLMLDESNVVGFIKAEPSRDLFYRPSLSYFLGRLWFSDRQLFWNTATKFFSKASALPARAYGLPGLTIFNCAQNPDDLAPLVALDNAERSRGLQSVLRSLQAFEGLNGWRRELWIRFLARTAATLSLEFTNEYLSLLEVASTVTDLENALKHELALAAVATLRWMWQTAKTANESSKAQLLSIAASRVLPIVIELSWLAPDLGRAVVEDVLRRIGTPDSSADEPYWLAHSLEPLIALDPSLVSKIYARIFSYREISRDSTHMGGIVLPITSNRAQDYAMAYYALEMKFPRLFDADPVEATTALALALNAEVEREHFTESDGLRTHYDNRPQFTFSYLGHDTGFVPDASEMWDHRIQEETSLKLLDWWLQRNTESIEKSEVSVESATDRFRTLASHNPYPVAWKRLLEFAKHRPAPLRRFVLPLLCSSDVLAAGETSVAAGDVIAAIHSQLDASEKAGIEAAIMATINSPVSTIYKSPELVRNRLLGCIPQGDFASEEAREAAEEQRRADRVPENRPYITIGGARAIQYTEEDWLKEKGVDVEQTSNKEALEIKKPLAHFEQRYLNEVPPTDEATKMVRFLRKALDVIAKGTDTNDQVVDSLLTSAAGVAESILKISDLAKEDELVQLCRETLLQAAHVISPVSPEADEHFDHPMWGPTPQIEAAQGLMRYIWHFGLSDSPVAATIESLSASRSPAVRYQVASQLLAFHKVSPEEFWRIAEGMTFAEQSTGVLNALLRSIGHRYLQRREPDKIVALYSARRRQGFPAQRTEDIIEVFSHVLVELMVFGGSETAHELVSGLLADPVANSAYLPQLALSSALYLHGTAEESGESQAIRRRAGSLVLEVLSGVQNGWVQLAATPPDAEQKATVLKGFFNAVDNVVFRISLASGANPALARDDVHPVSGTQVKRFFDEVRPILTFVTAAQFKHRYISPHTAQNLMELFNRFLEFDPVFIVGLAAQLCSANLLGYQFDQQAITEVMKLVETFLADYRQYLSDSAVAANIGSILDLFINAGWPQATRILMSVDRAMA